MPHQFDALASRAISLARCIDHDILIVLDFQQMLPGAFLFLVNTLKLERVEPNAAATALANVHLQISHLPPGQFIEASWTFHGWALSAILKPTQLRPPRSLRAIPAPPSNQSV
jgi:hypothetical protein